jgi:hypothetical protein
VVWLIVIVVGGVPRLGRVRIGPDPAACIPTVLLDSEPGVVAHGFSVSDLLAVIGVELGSSKLIVLVNVSFT